jgi:hypothetical protein
MADQGDGNVLHYLWYPIGVAGKVLARVECTGYVPRLMTLLEASTAANVIADYLTEISSNHVELASQSDQPQRR